MCSMSDWSPITTSRLVLRRVSENDLPLMVQLNTDPRVLRFLQRDIPTKEDIARQLDESIAEYGPGSNPGRLIAFRREDGEFVGRFSLLDYPGDQTLSLGYRLLPSCWGQGLATEGAKALIDHGFAMPGIQCIRAQTMFVNAASRRVMERAGMRYAWTFHPEFDDPLPGTELGEVEYAITKQEWVASRDGS